MSRFRFEPAAAHHDADLRRLFAENEMEGNIAISFRREPSYFYASQVQGAFYQVFAGRDTQTGEVIGVATRAVRQGFLNGAVEEIGYLADMRLDQRYRGGVLVARAYRYLERLHQDGRVRLYFTVIAEGNRQALKTIATGRAGLPPYRDMGRLLSPAINLLRPKPSLNNGIQIVRGTDALLLEIVACLNRNHQRRQFAPCYTVDQFQSRRTSPRAMDGGAEFLAVSTPSNSPLVGGNGGTAPINSCLAGDLVGPANPPVGGGLRDFYMEDFYVALKEDRVVGVLGKWDQGAYKQTVVTGYHGKLRLIRPALNLAAAVMGCARYPAPGESLRSFYASFIAIDHDDLQVFRTLLSKLYNDHIGSGYAYFLVGLHELDPLAAVLSDFSLTPFAARLFAVHFADGEECFRSLDGRTPYIELAML